MMEARKKRMSLEEKVQVLVQELRKYGKGMKLTKERLNTEITRTLGIWRTEQLTAFRRALNATGWIVGWDDEFTWGNRARVLFEQEEEKREGA
jgi:hypothetical protein